MARATPYVRGGALHVDGREPVAVGSAGWWRWLDARTSTTVRIDDAEPAYTARREDRGPSGYWYGHRRTGGQLRKVYLGRPADVTAERLQQAAELLADDDGPELVGRGGAVAEISRQLRRSRVVALVGPGGIGKSRLAAAVARSRSSVEDVYRVAPGAARDGELVAAALARALGLPDHGIAALVDTIGQRRMLIAFDGCERAAAAVAAVVDDLVAGCRNVRVLATSRAPLRLPGAVTWRVPPLDVPAANADAGAVLGTGAGRLLRARARLTDPGLVVTDENAGTLALICRRLDGVPLAVELAAARLGTLSVETLAAHLEAGAPEAVDDVVTWSHDQLGESARAVFARLGVFIGGWDAEAAAAVCADTTLPASVVVRELATLVEVSLVHVAAGRYRMLDVVRRFAAGRLSARGEQDAVRDRHAAVLLARAEQADPMGYDRASEQHRRGLDVDTENLRAALDRLLEQDDVAAAWRMGTALAQFWEASGAVREGRRRLVELLALPGDPPARLVVGAGLLAALDGDYPAAGSLLDRARCADIDPPAAANAWYLAGLLAWWRRDYVGAGAAAAEGEQAGWAADRPGLVGLNLWTRAQVAATCGDPDAAWRLTERALRLCADDDHPLGVASALNLMGQLLLDRGEFEAARDLLDRALAECRTFGWPALELSTLLALARAAWGRGDLDSAQTRVAQGLTLARERLGPSRLCQPVEAAALLAAAHGRWTRCLRLAAAAAALRDRHQVVPVPAERVRVAAALARARNAVGPARAAAAVAAGRAAAADALHVDALHGGDADPAPGRLADDRLAPLTARQGDVARLVADGLSNKELAGRLRLAEATVERHLVNIFRTLDLRSRTQLATWVTSRPGRPDDLRRAPPPASE